MPGKKKAKLAHEGKQGQARKHYCPACVGNSGEFSSNMEMKPVMVMPSRRIKFVCSEGHEQARGGTILT
jgi:hypothetical protein